MCVRVIGDSTMFDKDLQEKIKELEEYSKQYDELHFQIALNYGSRDEIKRAVMKMAEDVEKGALLPVSYTHLDVYKRQIRYTVGLWLGFFRFFEKSYF